MDKFVSLIVCMWVWSVFQVSNSCSMDLGCPLLRGSSDRRLRRRAATITIYNILWFSCLCRTTGQSVATFTVFVNIFHIADTKRCQSICFWISTGSIVFSTKYNMKLRGSSTVKVLLKGYSPFSLVSAVGENKWGTIHRQQHPFAQCLIQFASINRRGIIANCSRHLFMSAKQIFARRKEESMWKKPYQRIINGRYFELNKQNMIE